MKKERERERECQSVSVRKRRTRDKWETREEKNGKNRNWTEERRGERD